MERASAAPVDPAILAEQVAYYRARASEYDEWWFRKGRYDRGDELNAAWAAEVGDVESALTAWLDRSSPQHAVELACGTGLFTRLLAPRVGHLAALDASPEALAINRARVGAANVDYTQADLFAWNPPRHYDFVFMSFWLSHVPDDRFDRFWMTVRDALAPGGRAYVIDSAYDPTSTATNHARPDRALGVVTRKLNDGREFRIVKIFHEPKTLVRRLAALGLTAEITGTARYFLHGTVASAAR